MVSLNPNNFAEHICELWVSKRLIIMFCCTSEDGMHLHFLKKIFKSARFSFLSADAFSIQVPAAAMHYCIA